MLIELDAGVDRRDNVFHDVGLVQAKIGRLGAINVDDVFRIIKPLHDSTIHDAVDVRDRALNVFRDVMRKRRILRSNPHINGCRLSFVHGAADHPTRVEGKFQRRELRVLGKARAKQIDVFLRGALLAPIRAAL